MLQAGHTLERPETVLPAYALLNRIRLTSSDAVLAAAEQTIKNIAEQYFAPNLTTEDMRDLARSGREDHSLQDGAPSKPCKRRARAWALSHPIIRAAL